MANRTSTPDALETIDLTTLQAVTGGRISRSGAPDPSVLAGIKQLAELISQVGQGLVQAKASSGQQMMQMMQQMMQARGGK